MRGPGRIEISRGIHFFLMYILLMQFQHLLASLGKYEKRSAAPKDGVRSPTRRRTANQRRQADKAAAGEARGGRRNWVEFDLLFYLRIEINQV